MGSRLSAFAVVNNSDADDDDDGFLGYVKEDQTDNSDSKDKSLEPISLQFELDSQLPQLQQSQQLPVPSSIINNNNNNNSRSSSIQPNITYSRFEPNDHNVIFQDDSVIIGLKSTEHLIIRGQFKLTVQRGAIQIDSVKFHANPYRNIPILSIPLGSMPVISPTQVTNMDVTIDDKNEDNEHLFTQEYKSVIKITNNFNGLEKIVELFPQFKNAFLFGNSRIDNSDNDEVKSNNSSYNEDLFFGYSFCPVLRQQINPFLGTHISKSWKLSFDNLVQEYTSILENNDSDSDNKMRVMIIGPKNSGKSTFLRILLNKLIQANIEFENNKTISVLDIDPGQPEYSPSDCISLCNFNEPIFGMNLPSLSSDDNDTNNYETVKTKYVGFTSPQREPTRYMHYIDQLLSAHRDSYSSDCLLLNAPGWVKGYGIEVLSQVSEKLQPTHLIYLNSPLIEDSENELLNRLSYKSLSKIQGIYINNDDSEIVRYSPSQIRSFKTLSYFHRISKNNNSNDDDNNLQFDFSPLLTKSPFKVSYMDKLPEDSESALTSPDFQMSLMGVSIFDSNNLNHEDVLNCLEAQVVGIYAIEIEEYLNLISFKQKDFLVSSLNNSLNLLSSDLVNEEYCYFIGLGLIHSVNTDENYVNMYTPLSSQYLRNMTLGENGYTQHKFFLVKGRTDIPVEELTPRFIYPKYETIRKIDVNGKRKKKVIEVKLPYVTFSSNRGKGGKAVNVRRNVNRRGLQ